MQIALTRRSRNKGPELLISAALHCVTFLLGVLVCKYWASSTKTVCKYWASSTKTGAATIQTKTTAAKEPSSKGNFFSYDPNQWPEPKIVVVATPHKAGSTTIQIWLSKLFRTEIDTDREKILPRILPRNNTGLLLPKSDWLWPVGLSGQYPYAKMLGPAKAFDALAEFVDHASELKRFPKYRPAWTDEAHRSVADWYKALFRIPVDAGYKLVFGAEAFDKMVQSLDQVPVSARGEDTHVAPNANRNLDRLLDLLPLEDDVQDLEVYMHHRTPRISHVTSLWHLLVRSKDLSLREFLSQKPERLTSINSLAAALQYCRRGIRTTLIDMQGVKHSSPAAAPDGAEIPPRTVQEVAACDVLRIDDCDSDGRILQHKRPAVLALVTRVSNQKADPGDKELTDEQLDELDAVLDAYDCGVWQHLRKYQERGLLRVLHADPDTLFASCEFPSRDISHNEMVDALAAIADNATAGGR